MRPTSSMPMSTHSPPNDMRMSAQFPAIVYGVAGLARPPTCRTWKVARRRQAQDGCNEVYKNSEPKHSECARLVLSFNRAQVRPLPPRVHRRRQRSSPKQQIANTLLFAPSCEMFAPESCKTAFFQKRTSPALNETYPQDTQVCTTLDRRQRFHNTQFAHFHNSQHDLKAP